MNTRRFTAPDLSDAIEDTVGPYKLSMVYRQVPNDEGPTVHVFGPVEGDEKEILRFDCFKKEPHFHVGISYLSEPVQMIEADDPLAWTLEVLAHQFPDYLAKSKAGCELPTDWEAIAGRAIESFRTRAAEWGKT